LTILGIITFLAGLILAPERAWADLLIVSFYLLGLGLAGAVIVALLYVTSAGWGTALRRVPEAMVAIIPAGMLGMVLVFAGQPSLYPWTADHANANHSASAFTAAWLTWPFFLVRAGVYFGLWYLLATTLVRNSRRQDASGDLALTQKNVRLSA